MDRRIMCVVDCYLGGSIHGCAGTSALVCFRSSGFKSRRGEGLDGDFHVYTMFTSLRLLLYMPMHDDWFRYYLRLTPRD